MSQTEGYLRIGELARRTETSPELLRAWEQRYGLLRPMRSEGGFRLYSDQDEARVLRTKSLIAEGLSASEAARRALGPEGPTGEQEDLPAAEGLAAEFREALDRFDEDGANRTLDRLLAALSLETVMQQVLLPYLHVLGDRWASGEISVAQEHFASSLIRGRLLGLARGWGAGRGQALLLACPPGEEHDRADHVRHRRVASGLADRLPWAGHAGRDDRPGRGRGGSGARRAGCRRGHADREPHARAAGCWPAASRWPWVAASGPRSSRGSGSGCSRATPVEAARSITS